MGKKKASEKVLIITSSGGGGLLIAAVAKEQEVLANNPDAIIYKRDFMLDWAWGWIGRFGVFAWNKAQRKGNVLSQVILAKFQIVSEFLNWPKVFVEVYRIISREKIDRVIDTQILGLGAIMKAIRLYNHLNKRKVRIEKLVVDLPTKKSTHFFSPLKKLSKQDRLLMKLISIEPLLEEGQTEEEFWQKHCGFSADEVLYEKFPIRNSFRKYMKKEKKVSAVDIPIKACSAEEEAAIYASYKRGSAKVQRTEEGFSFAVKPEDRLIVVLLGTQPSFHGSLNYVKNFASIVRELKDKKRQYHLFVFCNKYDARHSLFQTISDYVLSAPDFPSNLSVVPMSFQSEDVIAKLFFRCNISITRSGGQTAMELMGLSSGEVWVHSESSCKLPQPSFKELLKGIPVWEAGNACYLKEKRDGKLVTPNVLSSLFHDSFKDG